MLGTGKLLRNPTNAELALTTGLRGRDHASGDDGHDVTIVGAGPPDWPPRSTPHPTD